VPWARRTDGQLPAAAGEERIGSNEQSIGALARETGMGHKNIMHTVRYTEMAPDRFKNFWKDSESNPKTEYQKEKAEEKCSMPRRRPNLYVRPLYNVKLAYQFLRDVVVEKPFGQWFV
jgi:hypothetical protein